MVADKKRRPTHPGAVLREIVMPGAGINQMTLAKALGVSRYAISQIVRERRTINADIAHRLGRLFGNGPGLWLRMQQAVDLWDAEQLNSSVYNQIHVKAEMKAKTRIAKSGRFRNPGR